MTTAQPVTSPEQISAQDVAQNTDAPVTVDALVEEVSIDGMCGVY